MGSRTSDGPRILHDRKFNRKHQNRVSVVRRTVFATVLYTLGRHGQSDGYKHMEVQENSLHILGVMIERTDALSNEEFFQVLNGYSSPLLEPF